MRSAGIQSSSHLGAQVLRGGQAGFPRVPPLEGPAVLRRGDLLGGQRLRAVLRLRALQRRRVVQRQHCRVGVRLGGPHRLCTQAKSNFREVRILIIACLKYILNPILLPNQTVPEEYSGVC